MYCERELRVITPLILKHGYTLDTVQPHLQGERYLMNAVTTTSGKKLILYGTDSTGLRVVIKVSREKNGIEEINHERTCRTILTHIDFARDVFKTPKECAYIEEKGYVISIQEFIPQEITFLERTLEEQFFFALDAFKSQEGAHATTYNHRKLIKNVFGIRTGETYIDSFNSFQKRIGEKVPHETDLLSNLDEAVKILISEKNTIEQYAGFLTHTDFVPHNIRIMDDTIYLLDHSSITFGNKYEGWARFINFMTLYNPPLQKALEAYVRDNRTPEESQVLHLMRIYRLGEIIWYYVKTLEKSTGSLLELNTKRVHFWNTVLRHVIDKRELPTEIIEDYTTNRDTLRSDDEKKRQQGLH